MDYSPEFIDLLKQNDIRYLLQDKKFDQLYKEIGRDNTLIPLLTKFSLDVLKINPLLYMDHVPYSFAENLDIEKFSIPDTIKSIGDKSFFYCHSLTDIQISDSVTSIGSNAFQSCTSLTSIEIPNSVMSIGNNAFWNCRSLTSITIPDNVTSIGVQAFYGCTSLTSVTIGDGVTSIGGGAFEYCTSLKSIKYLGTKKQALTKLKVRNKSWRADSSISKIICTDGVIEL